MRYECPWLRITTEPNSENQRIPLFLMDREQGLNSKTLFLKEQNTKQKLEYTKQFLLLQLYWFFCFAINKFFIYKNSIIYIYKIQILCFCSWYKSLISKCRNSTYILFRTRWKILVLYKFPLLPLYLFNHLIYFYKYFLYILKRIFFISSVTY